METTELSLYDIPVKRTVLDNGFNVFTMDMKTKTTLVQLAFRVGSCRDGKFPGMAHFIEHLNMGTEKGEPIHPLIRPLVYRGATSNAGTGYVQTEYFVKGPSEIAYESARTLIRMIFAGDFSPKQVEIERQIMLNECRQKATSEKYRTLSARTFYPHINIRHNSPLGTARSFENVTLERIKDHHTDFYTPDNACIVAVGSVNHEDFVETVARERFPQTRCNAPPLPEEKPKLHRAGIEDDILPTSISLIFEGTKDWKENVAISRALGLMLQTTVGTLFHRLRYRDGLVYQVQSTVSNCPQEIGVQAPTKPLHFNYAEESFFEEVGRISNNDISQEGFDLLALRYRLFCAEQLEIVGIGKMVDEITASWLGSHYEDERPFRLALTREQVAEAARKFLRRDAYGCLHIFRK